MDRKKKQKLYEVVDVTFRFKNIIAIDIIVPHRGSWSKQGLLEVDDKERTNSHSNRAASPLQSKATTQMWAKMGSSYTKDSEYKR